MSPALSARIAEDFPSIEQWDGSSVMEREAQIDARAWLAPDADLFAFDRLIRGTEPFGSFVLTVSGRKRELERAVPGILTRYQRLFPRKNRYSESAFFSSVLAFHRAVHPIERQRVSAEYDHALDVWQWVLRLRPDASLAVQLAALFHDIERLLSGCDRRIEHHAVGAHDHDDPHVKRGGEMVRRILRRLEAWPLLVERVAMLVDRQIELDGGDDLSLLDDADELSFFSLGSADFVDRHGWARAADKVDDALSHMRPEARVLLGQIRHAPGIENMIARSIDLPRIPPPTAAAAARKGASTWCPVLIS